MGEYGLTAGDLEGKRDRAGIRKWVKAWDENTAVQKSSWRRDEEDACVPWWLEHFFGAMTCGRCFGETIHVDAEDINRDEGQLF